MINSVASVSGYFTLGGAGWTGLPGDTGVVPGGNASRLLEDAGSKLQALDQGRDGVDRIKAALTKLRDALQAARDAADAVPGRTVLRPVSVDVEQTQDKPTYVTIDGAVVQDGTITVSLGPRPLVVGYQRVDRAPLAVGDALKSLAATVATLESTVGADGTGGLAAEVSALLRNEDFKTAVNRPDAASIDAAIGRIDATLAKAAGSRFLIGARASAAAQIDFGDLLLGASSYAGFDTSGPAGNSQASS